MITTTWTEAPADLLGQGSAAVRPCTGMDVAVSPVLRAPVTPVVATGLPFGGIAVRRNAQTAPRTTAFAHNSIAVANDGAHLGILSSRRPQS